MRVSYQHTNPRTGNESTLLRFTTDDGKRACVLIDCGAGVDVDSLLDEDEYLNAILLTHAHIDHYRTLGKNSKHSAPIYTSPATAAALGHALPEARKDNDLGDIENALDAIEPITSWTSILETLEVRPVPAGHAPGAAGFVIRFRDGTESTLPLANENHLLATGDFTTRPCAGFSGLPAEYPFDIDAVLVNVPTSDSSTAVHNESITTILERAAAGSRVVVGCGSLTGVHYAALIGAAIETIGRKIPVTIVGQAARLYQALEMDAPGVEVREVFDTPTEVLEHGGVTIAGPSAPTKGSTKRLFQAIKTDADGVFVQLAGEDHDREVGSQCTTHRYEYANHPDTDTIDDLVKRLAPKEVVLKHATGDTLKRFQRRFDRCFTWGTDDSKRYRLYDDGEWQAPPWLSEKATKQIRTNQWNAVREKSVHVGTDLPAVGRKAVDIEAEGVHTDALRATFSRNSPESTETTATGDETPLLSTKPASGEATETDTAKRESSEATSPSECVEGGIQARLAEIEERLARSERTVPARVFDGGDETQLLQLLERTDLEPGSVVEVDLLVRE